MYLTLNVGGTGTGKSTYVYDLIKKGVRLFIFDVQNEYTEVPYFNKDQPCKQMRYYGDFEKFLDIVEKLPKGFCVVVEEASGEFSSNVGQRFTKIILSKRHTMTSWVLNFHGLQMIPPRICTYKDVILLRKTGDYEKDVQKKFPELVDIWKKIRSSKNRYEKKIIYCSNLTQNL